MSSLESSSTAMPMNTGLSKSTNFFFTMTAKSDSLNSLYPVYSGFTVSFIALGPYSYSGSNLPSSKDLSVGHLSAAKPTATMQIHIDWIGRR